MFDGGQDGQLNVVLTSSDPLNWPNDCDQTTFVSPGYFQGMDYALADQSNLFTINPFCGQQEGLSCIYKRSKDSSGKWTNKKQSPFQQANSFNATSILSSYGTLWTMMSPISGSGHKIIALDEDKVSFKQEYLFEGIHVDQT